ncbi:MAG: SusD/RagB family nutrient-binding outer membrane lipoprotein [Saprospiraceae bacterium]
MKKYFHLFSLLLFLVACTKDFKEINQNPFSPTQTDIGPLFNTVVASLRLGGNEQFYLHNETLYGITQQAAKAAVAFDNITIGTEEVWKNYYTALAHVREIEKRLDEMEIEAEALNNVRAQLKILLAYKTFRLTDLFGDIPFSEAGRGFESLDYTRPKFDSQEGIYHLMLEELKWAEDHINTFPSPETAAGTPYISFGNFDNFFNGDMRLWRKFANSLRLRHAIRMVEKDPDFAKPIIKDILENNLPLIEEGEDVVMSPSAQQWNNEGVNWSFREHEKLRMGSTIWSWLSDNDNKDGSGIFDPRARIFFETNNNNEWVAFPQVPPPGTPPAGGIPYEQHRDFNYVIKGAANIYSPFNYYLIRDEKTIPEIIMTAAEVGFLKAEAYFRGLGVEVNESEAENIYTVAVRGSILFWQNVVTGSSIWENKPNIYTGNEIYGLISHPKMNIFGSDNQLEKIYAQRWLDAFRQPWEAFALWRRTGMTPRTGDAPAYYRFAYPPSEATNNPENWADQVSKMGSDAPEVKVWWMK